MLTGNGDGTFESVTAHNVGTSPMSVALGDVNGDGKLDLARAPSPPTRIRGQGVSGARCQGVIRYDPAKPSAPVDIFVNGKKIQTAKVVDVYANCRIN